MKNLFHRLTFISDIKTCPSSIALYFCKKGYKVTTCNIDVKKKLNYNVQVPIYDEETDPDSLLEWLGAFNLQCNMYVLFCLN